MAKDFGVGFTVTSDFDGKGITEAKKGINDVTTAAKGANAATGSLSTSAKGLKGSFTSAAKSAGALTYVLGEGKGMAGITKYLGLAIGALAMGPLGMLIGALTAGITIFNSFKARAEEAKEKLQTFKDTVAGNARAIEAANIERLAKQYDVLATEIDNAANARKRLNAASDSVAVAVVSGKSKETELERQQALDGLATDDYVGRAKVNAEYDKKQRDMAAEAARKQAENKLADKGSEITDATTKRNFTSAKLADTKAAMDEKEAQIRKVNEALADLYGKGAPTKKEIVGGYGQNTMYKTVVDEAKQKQQAASLLEQLNGKKDSPGLEANYKRLSEIYAETYDKLQAENKGVDALVVERDALTKELENSTMLQAQNQELSAKAQKLAALRDQQQATEIELQSQEADLVSATDALTTARNNAAKAQAIGDAQAKIRDGIASQTASGFINDREGKRDAAKEEQKQNERDKNRADRLRASLKRNGKLSKANGEWLNLYDEWAQAKNAGGAGGRVKDAAEADLRAAMASISGLKAEVEKSKDELVKIRESLEKNLTEGGR